MAPPWEEFILDYGLMQYQHDDVRKRAQAACSVNISYFCQNYDDIDSLSDLIPFNIGLSKVDAFYNEIFDDKEKIQIISSKQSSKVLT